MRGNYVIDFAALLTIDNEKFDLLCRHNPDIKFERNHQGKLIIMSPAGGESGIRNTDDLTGQFWLWNRQAKLGKVFDSSTCFRLPNGANLSPDVSWLKQARWDELTSQQKATFPPIAPDFVLELISPNNNLKKYSKEDAGVFGCWC